MRFWRTRLKVDVVNHCPHVKTLEKEVVFICYLLKGRAWLK